MIFLVGHATCTRIITRGKERKKERKLRNTLVSMDILSSFSQMPLNWHIKKDELAIIDCSEFGKYRLLRIGLDLGIIRRMYSEKPFEEIKKSSFGVF